MSDNSAVNHEPTGTLELVTRATKEGAANAREAAIKTWAATSLFACRFAYTTCYTLSYGVVFPATFIACAIPKNNAMVRGMIDGAHAAKAKVAEIRKTSTAETPAHAFATS